MAFRGVTLDLLIRYSHEFRRYMMPASVRL